MPAPGNESPTAAQPGNGEGPNHGAIVPGYTVAIEQDGRGGSIIYREGENTARFSWEFAMPPAIALLFAPSPFPEWARGRRAEIFAAVGAEVVRQKAPGGRFTVDLEAGMMDILR